MILVGGLVQAAGNTVDTSVVGVDRPSCQSLQIPTRITASKRTVTPNDLLRLRDFGGSEIFESGAPGFALSPDGQHLAVQVRQAEPSSNAYCQALMLFPLAAKHGAPELLDRGGEFVRGSFELYGLNGFPAGTPEPLTPRWSPDGRWIAFLRRDEGVTRLWIVSPKGGAARAVTDSAADVVEFKWKVASVKVV
jgi:hypothetical protein